MTDADLDQIEAALGVTLPADYRRVMTKPAAAAGPDEFWHFNLFNHADRVIRDTGWLRDLVEDCGAAWPAGHVVISEVNGGDMIVLDATRSDAPVLVWDHETSRFETFMKREFLTVEGLTGQPRDPG